MPSSTPRGFQRDPICYNRPSTRRGMIHRTTTKRSKMEGIEFSLADARMAGARKPINGTTSPILAQMRRPMARWNRPGQWDAWEAAVVSFWAILARQDLNRLRWGFVGASLGLHQKSHSSTCTQRKEANEGALESSCRAVNGLGTGWVHGGGLVEKWWRHVALYTRPIAGIRIPTRFWHEGALESSCRAVNGLGAGEVLGGGLVEKW